MRSTEFDGLLKIDGSPTIGGIGIRPIWLGSCDISASKSLPEGRIFRGRILQTYLLSQGKPLQGWPDNDAFKSPQFLHWKKLLKSPPKGCHRHVKLIEDPARFPQQHWKHVGESWGFHPIWDVRHGWVQLSGCPKLFCKSRCHRWEWEAWSACLRSIFQ